MRQILAGQIIIVLLLMVLISGCSRRMIDFTIISSKNTQLQIPEEAMGERVEGEDTVLWLFVGFGYIPLWYTGNQGSS